VSIEQSTRSRNKDSQNLYRQVDAVVKTHKNEERPAQFPETGRSIC
jgi:hypothetical protein